VVTNSCMPTQDETDIASMRARLEQIETERSALSERLGRLQSKATSVGTGHAVSAPITAHSKAAEKIGLFRRLFAGRAWIGGAWRQRRLRYQLATGIQHAASLAFHLNLSKAMCYSPPQPAFKGRIL
jgi:hypothetical protein